MYRREVRAEAKKRVKAMQKMVRPEPLLIPTFIWKWLVYYILRIKV